MKDALGSVQSVLLLGGTSEIGLATVRALVARRARDVILAARRPTRLEATATELRAAGASSVELVEFDADDIDSHPKFVEEVFSRAGDIDLVLLSFGVLGHRAGIDLDADEAVEIVRTNYLDAVSVLLPVARRLHAQGHGTVVVLSSVAGERVRKSNFVYGSSKAGLDGFAQGLGDSLVGSGVHVLIVRPGFVATKMTAGLQPPPLSTSAEVVATAILNGLQRNARIVWVPPVLRWVMMIVRHMPRALFRRIPL